LNSKSPEETNFSLLSTKLKIRYHRMRNKSLLKITIWIASILLSIIFLTTVIIKPWIGKKIQAAFNEKNKNYQVKLKKISISIISSSIELKGITLNSHKSIGGNPDSKAEIASIKFSGINFTKLLIRKDISIREVKISGGKIKGKIPTARKPAPPIIIPLNISIGTIIIDKADISIVDSSSARRYSIKEGILKVYDIQVAKKDTLSPAIVHNFDFSASEYVSVSSDSMYSFIAKDILYTTTSKALTSSKLSIHPNYANYDFSSRHKYQTDCIEAELSNICIHDFNALDYLRSGNIISSYIEITKMDLKAFRDKRKEFKHVKKTAFQDLIYNYPATLIIDSIRILNGNIEYTEHARDANEPGKLYFDKVNATFYKLTNDTIYKTKPASFELKCNALLMGKGRINVVLKATIFDHNNTFSLYGTVSDMEAKELNPYLDRNAFMYLTSGIMDGMKFSFIANNSRAKGKMTLLYHGLEITVKNKRTDDTTAFKERFVSLIVNSKIIKSNPLPHEKARIGIIDYERDPEKFIFDYWVKSVLSGIKSSLIKNPKK